MASAAGTIELLVRELAEALKPLEQRLSAGGVDGLFDDLGLRLPSGFSSHVPFANALAGAAASAAELPALIVKLTAAIDADDVVQIVARGQALLGKAKQLIDAIPQIATGLSNAAAGFGALTPAERTEIDNFAQELPRRLLDRLVVGYLETKTPAGIPPTLTLLGFIDRELEPGVAGNALRPPFLRKTLHLERIPKLFGDPAAYLREVYGWGSPTFDGLELLENVRRFVAGFLDMPADLLLAPGLPPILEAYLFALRVNPATSPPGVIVDFRFPATEDFERTYTLRPPWVLKMTAQARFVADVMTTITPPLDASLRPPNGAANMDFTAGLAADDAGNPILLLGEAGGSRLEATHVGVSAGLAANFDGETANGQPLGIIEVRGGKLIISTARSDGFIQTILAGVNVQPNFELKARWRPSTGIVLEGGTGIERVIPTHLNLGPVEIQMLYFKFGFTNETPLRVEVAAALVATLGPLTISVDGVGAAFNFTFPAQRNGNLGPADLDVSYKPPNGVGLSLDATVVVGGGFLSFDPQKEEYGGILQLEIAEKISVKAIGLLTTRLPDGAKGYSLVLIIFVEGFAPIQLGFGFALTGIGGLLGINRTFDEEALRAGLKNHTLDSVMFPKDPIRNAPQILSNLNKVFPPANGHHLFGPMVQIAWGTPALITADLGVVLELGARLRLLILAQVVAILPKRENDLVRLQMDAIGVLDFDQGNASLDATLYDSRLLKKFVLTGDMAMRLKWEGSPNFALAVGGLHPAFNPPSNFPKLERIAINLSAGDNPRIRCEAYFALTANTVQFGARAELYVSASGFSIQGEYGYDVLIQLDPFYFLADFYAQLQLKRGSTNLFKVRVEGALAGPRPLHIKAKATFEILWWDYSIRIDRTLVEGEKPPPPEPIDVLPRLKEALGNPGNWIDQLPAGQRPMVTLRATTGAATEVLLHPLGKLTVKQGVVPLNLDISRFGQAAPAGARHFTISSVSLGGQSPATEPVRDFFAPAQFFEMSDDEKLSRPSFEPMPAGVSIGSDELVFSADANDWLEVKGIEFETIIVDKEKNESRPSHPEAPKDLYKLTPVLLGKQATFGAAGNSDLHRTGRAKYRTTIGKHRVEKEGWSIVATDDLTVQPVPGIEDGKPTIYSEAAQALQKLKQENPAKAAGLKILRLSEVQESIA